MNEALIIEIERIDELPILLAQLKQMQVGGLLDQYFPAHANWQGASLGQLVVVWLCHIISEANHRLNHVRPWVKERPHTLQSGLGVALTELDFTDDRLASVLDRLSQDARWEQFEQALGQHLVRVYDLGAGPVGVDSTAASAYATVSPDGLFQFGHSKDHRPDLPQLKIQLAVLDPLGLPVSSTIVSGERADDGLYIPEIKKVQQTLQRKGLLYVGDCKMAALQTRAYLAKSEDYYLTPLSAVQMPPEKLAELLEPVWSHKQPLTDLYQSVVESEEGEASLIGQGFSLWRNQSALIAGVEHHWSERMLVVRSAKLALAAKQSLHNRLLKAQSELEKLNERKRGKRRFENLAQLQGAVESIIQRFKVAGLVQVNYVQTLKLQTRRRYKERPAQPIESWEGQVVVSLEQAAIERTEREMGWRVYVTNQSEAELSLQAAVLAYRSKYLVERNFGRLKGRGLSLQPMYLAVDSRVKGLVRLLTIGLRVLTLLEFEVRRKLANQNEKVAGLYDGQPKRSTARPTAEKILRAFSGINLSNIVIPGHSYYHVTPLSVLQKRLLELLGFSSELFLSLTLNSYQPLLE